MASAERIPAFLNPHAGTAGPAGEALREDARFELRELNPDGLTTTLRLELMAGARRVLVCGGDGSLATAASVLAGTNVELAVLPGGTLNHFARDHGIPTDPGEALDLAAGDATRPVDVGFVNERLFLNTSSVGAYVRFVRDRERLERWLGYRLASLVASLRVLVRVRSYSLVIEAESQVERYRTPLVFVGVGERELSVPGLGQRGEGGERCLHAVVVHGRGGARLLVRALASVAAGVEPITRSPHMDAFLVDRCTVEVPRPQATVSVDGEIVRLPSPLRYRIERDALRIVAPAVRAASG